MIFGRSGDPAYTVPGFAARHADLLVPIVADIKVIIPRLSGTVNSMAAHRTTISVSAHATFQRRSRL
jgi:hypothetical protein